MKSGYKTTEFWLNVLVALINLGVAIGAISSDDVTALEAMLPAAATTLAAIAYTISRYLLKANAIE